GRGMAEAARILLADDEPIFREKAAAMLRAEGYECLCAEDARDALRVVRERAPDVALMDIRMQGNETLQGVRELAEIAREIPVILVTGYPSLPTALAAIDLHVAAYLVKPVRFTELRARVMQVLARAEGRSERSEEQRRLHEVEAALERMAWELEQLGFSTGILGEPAEETNLAELAQLTTREREVVCELLRGYRVSTISAKLCISQNTVRNHLQSIFAKLGVHSQTELQLKLKPLSMGPSGRR
ncbi:MAG: response regulator, partial [Myxococcota bacterium]